MTTIFFRDDDVGELDQPLRCVVELLVEEEIPCSYQVVPKFLDDAAAAYVTAAQRDHPGLVRLNQHGLHHEQVINGERRWSEFDGNRGYDEQRRDIEKGRESPAQTVAGRVCAPHGFADGAIASEPMALDSRF